MVAVTYFVAGKAEDRMDGVLSSLTPEEKARLQVERAALGAAALTDAAPSPRRPGRSLALAPPEEPQRRLASFGGCQSGREAARGGILHRATRRRTSSQWSTRRAPGCTIPSSRRCAAACPSAA